MNLHATTMKDIDIIHGSQMPYSPVPLSHRGKGLEFKYLFTGEDKTPENHVLLLGKQRGFYSPVHRHNFDQVRYAYSNSLSISTDSTLEEGEVGYFPEGVHYGPQDDGDRTSIQLVLQFGGASGQGYISQHQLKQANTELSKSGKFENGKYLVDGQQPQDGYEALYEYCKGEKLVYPKGRYHSPILISPANFDWRPVDDDGASSAWRKSLGCFTERNTKLELLRVTAGGKMEIAGTNAIQFLFVTNGDGDIEGHKCQKESAVRLTPRVGARISTESEMEIFRIVTPMLGEKGA